MPAFVKPNVYQVIKDNFNLVPIKSVEEDMEEILNN